jgi:RimJ/RimL family protein N-acetyltransferase
VTGIVIQIDTDRLQLRPLCDGDDPDVFALLSDERVVRHMLFPVFTREQARRFVTRAQQPAPAGEPAQAMAAIARRGDATTIGLCGLVLDRSGLQGELWYLLGPQSWGRGFATEAAGALVAHGFRALDLHRIWASCLPENPASARVLARLGFRHEGRHLQNLLIHGVWHDSDSYALLRREWTA